MRWLDDITDSMDMNLNKLREIEEVRGAWEAALVSASTVKWKPGTEVKSEHQL